MKDLKRLMYGNYNEEDLLKLYKLKLISLEKNCQNEELINYYKLEIARLNKNLELRKKYIKK